MLDYAVRLMFAFIVSAACFMGTWIWYKKHTIPEIVVEEAEQVAQLVSSENEVQRKPSNKIIWQSVTDNERLSVGDQIRTTSTSEARIEFLNSDDFIELEPNSMVVIDSLDGRLSLKFEKGNILVSGNGKNFDIFSGQKEIDVNNGVVSLGRSPAGLLDVQVIKGSAQIAQQGKTTMVEQGKALLVDKSGAELSQNMIEVVSPKQRENIYISPGENEFSKFVWKPLPEGYTVKLRSGNIRDELVDVKGAIYDAKENSISKRFTVGKIYWQLVGVPADKSKPALYSPIFRNAIIAKIPPVLIDPVQDSVVYLTKKNPTLIFRWGNPAKLSDLVLEVANDAKLKNIIKREKLPAKDFYDSDLKQEGTYYWRITGFLGDKKEPVVSPIQKFELKKGGELKPPKLVFPLAEESLPLNEVVERGVYLKWEKVPGVENYLVTFSYSGPEKGLFDGQDSGQEKSRNSQFQLPSIAAGEFTWQVQSIADDGKVSKASKPLRFYIETVQKLEWADKQRSDRQNFVKLPASWSVEWQKGQKSIKKYELRWSPDRSKLASAQWTTVNGLKYSDKVEEAGPVYVEVRGVNKSGTVVARTSMRVIVMEMTPVLPGPVFADSMTPQISAKRNGSADVLWKPVDGAKSYVVKLLDSGGNEVKKENTSGNSQKLTSLLPGTYEVQLQAIDEHGRPGRMGEKRTLTVPKKSDVKAPKIRAIKVN